MKLLYKPFGLVVTVLAGIASAALYKRVWRALAHETATPEAMDEDRGWREIVVASALKGAIFGVVGAVSRRSGATGYASLTGTWPGKRSASRERG